MFENFAFRVPRLVSLMATTGLAFLLACELPNSLIYGLQTNLPEQSRMGQFINDFQLQDIEGRTRSLGELGDRELVVVVFMGWECPLVRLYAPRLEEIKQEFADQSVAWLAINSNQHDSLAELKYFARTTQWSIPILKDPGNAIADLFGAERTPEIFVLDSKRKIRYHGKIDDQYTYGRQKPAVVTRYLADALEELVAGQDVTIAETETEGCIIGRVLAGGPASGQAPVTYSNQISRILQDHCTSCHRAGEVGPFELTQYDEVVGWAGMIQEVVNQRRMPPWHANPRHGQFKNDSRLSEDEIQMINQWVEAGAPQGDPQRLPQPRQFATGWQIGKPDLIVPMSQRAYRVPATGIVEYQYFEVDPGFTEDKWIKAAECRPGNRAVIHHIIVGIRGEGDFGRDHDGLHSDWIAAMAPGSPPMVLPTGYAKLVPKGSTLIFQMHYTPNGTATTDISKIGMVFADPDEVTHRVLTLKAHNDDFTIPAGASSHPVAAKYQFRGDAELLSLFPHMHLRGKSFRYTARYPGNQHNPQGTEEILLDVPDYDFNWQNAYELVQPKKIPRGTWIHCQARFDNSDQNLANPNPNEPVRWGDQTWEEMMIGYFNVAVEKDRGGRRR